MHILIAPDSFKGSLSADKIIDILSSKLEITSTIEKVPLADGGEGTLEVIAASKNFERKNLQVFNPLFIQINTYYFYDKITKTAYIEMAKASGLLLVNEFDILNSSSFGTGQLIKHAIENGCEKIVLFIGGSATNDAAIGIASALGLFFKDRLGENLKPIGKNLPNIYFIDDSKSVLKEYDVEILIAADVNNPFYGQNGAAHIYAAQKGASSKELIYLDKGLQNMATIFKKQFNVDVQKIKGSGAAGGVGGGMLAMFGAKLISGSKLIFELTSIEKKIKLADLIITGEGKIDKQTLNDKLIFKLTKLASLHHKKVWTVCGYFDGNDELKKLLGIEKVFSLAKSKNEIEFAMNNAEIKLSEIANELIKELNI